MTTMYTYSLTNDFTYSNAVNIPKLTWDIQENGTITSKLISVSNVGDDVFITLSDPLPLRQKTFLDVVIATHDSGGTIANTTSGSKIYGTIGINYDETIAYVASSSNGGANLTSLTLNVPTGTTRDMTMLCHITVRSNTSTYGYATSPAGWQLLRTNQNTDGAAYWRTMLVYIKNASTSEPSSYTWTSVGPASNYVAGGIASFSGVAAFNIINAEAARSTPSSLTHDVPAITTTVPNTMLIAYYSYASCATSWSLGGGMTQMYMANSASPPQSVGEGCVAGYKLQVGTGTVGGTGVFSAVASNDADDGLTDLLALTPAVNVIIPTTEAAFGIGVKNTTSLNLGNQNSPTNMYNLTAIAGYPTTSAATIIAAAGQSANILEIDDSNGTMLSGFNSNGQPILNGVTVSGPAATGQVIMATSSSLASWQSLNSWLNYQYAVSKSSVNTTSTTFQNKVTLTTTSLDSGLYRIGWHFYWQLSSTSTNYKARVLLNGSTTLMSIQIQPQSASTTLRHPICGFYITPSNISGSQTITLDYGVVTTGTAYIQAARLEIWRVA